jgi:hypothetical protein
MPLTCRQSLVDPVELIGLSASISDGSRPAAMLHILLE